MSASSSSVLVVLSRVVPSPPPLPAFSSKLFSKPPRDAAAVLESCTREINELGVSELIRKIETAAATQLQELLSIPTTTAFVSRLLVSPGPIKSFFTPSLMSFIFITTASSSKFHKKKKGETKAPVTPTMEFHNGWCQSFTRSMRSSLSIISFYKTRRTTPSSVLFCAVFLHILLCSLLRVKNSPQIQKSKRLEWRESGNTSKSSTASASCREDNGN